MCKEMMMIMFIPVWHSLSLRSFLFYQHLQAASTRVHCFISLFYSIQYFLFHSLLFLCARTFFSCVRRRHCVVFWLHSVLVVVLVVGVYDRQTITERGSAVANTAAALTHTIVRLYVWNVCQGRAFWSSQSEHECVCVCIYSPFQTAAAPPVRPLSVFGITGKWNVNREMMATSTATK